jgi:integrase
MSRLSFCSLEWHHHGTGLYLGIKWLSTYISVRLGELIKLTEGNIDTENGYLYIPLISEDVEILKSIPMTFPATPFFRYIAGIKGVAESAPFGIKYFYKWWVKAYANLGIEGVGLYGGTRHSSVRALRRYRTPVEIKEATMSATNKAFERYMGRANDGDILSIYKQSAEVIPISAPDTALIPQKMT